MLSLFHEGDWDNALVFGLAVAVGLTPQMLPMIVTANLSRSVRIMRAQKTAIRRMDAIQNLGSMWVPQLTPVHANVLSQEYTNLHECVISDPTPVKCRSVSCA